MYEDNYEPDDHLASQSEPLIMGKSTAITSVAQTDVGERSTDPNPDHHDDTASIAQLTRIPSHPLSTSSQIQYRVYKRRFFGLSVLIALNIVVSWGWLSLAPVSRTAATYFDVSESVVNWLSTAFFFAFVIATPATFYTLSKHGPKASIVVSATLLLIGNWVKYGGAKANKFSVVMLGQLFIGFAQPFVLAAPTTYSDLWFSPAGRTTATAAPSLANAFGAALGQLISPFWVGGPNDIPDSQLWVAIIASAVCIPGFFVPRGPPTPPAAQSEASRNLHNPSLSTIIFELKVLGGSLEFWLIAIAFWTYVGFFNALSSLLNQILEPYGFSEDQAGIAGAVLIVVGLVSAAISSPLNDKFKFYLVFVRLSVPVIGLSYFVFYWAPQSRSLGYVFVIMALIGAASFSLVPLILEFLVEILYPIGPSVSSSLCWSGGQLLGGIFVIVMDALKAGQNANPPLNMRRALIFQAVIALLIMPLPVCLGLFGRKEHIRLKRWELQKQNGTVHEDTQVADDEYTET